MCTRVMFGSLTALVLVAALSQTGSPVSTNAAAPFAIRPDMARAVSPQVAPVHEAMSRRSPALLALYGSFVALEVLDAQSTLHAIDSGAAEGNPAMRGITSNPASLVAVKAATGTLVILVSEKMRKQHPALAIGMMAAINSVMAAVVAHNYSTR